MSMEHKAFLFDTETFHTKIEPVMKASVNNAEAARDYISQNHTLFQSPYTGETLDEDWEDEFDDPSLQDYFDILLTACYDVEEDMGLGYMWDAVNGMIEKTGISDNPQIAVLGRELDIDGVQVDPGMMGLGIVESHDTAEIRDMLIENRMKAEAAEPDDALYDASPEERMEAYDNLCQLYDEAASEGKGLLFTF